ncbi:NAD(P)-dependent oxidoreductase [Streptosporangium sp. NPDC000396]|uniref:NAD(P)-dependent oxidoreductase n=1 Tax=Streptosporangium sp. NPDC000396 TaxID=3366185 RepID=UPI0036936A41
MKVAVVGAAGRTGGLLVEQALEENHEVTALVRSPGTMGTKHPRLRVARADVLDPDDLREPLRGHDAVVVTLGVKGRGRTALFSEGARNVIRAAEAASVRRLVVMSSAGLSTGHLPLAQRLVSEFVVGRIYHHIHHDLARMEAEVAGSGLDWTIVRVPMLKEGPRTQGYQVSVGGHLPKAGSATRANIADWIIRHLTDATAFRQRVEIADS